MKKLNLEKNAEVMTEISTEIRGGLDFRNDYNLLTYYINDMYLYIYNRVTKKAALYLFSGEEERDTVRIRIDAIKSNMGDSKVNMINFYEIKRQSKAIHANACNVRDVKKGVYRKDIFFKGFFIRCFTQNEQKGFNEFYNVLPNGYIFKDKRVYDFDKYIKIKELVNVWHRDDLIIMDNDKGEIVDNIEF